MKNLKFFFLALSLSIVACSEPCDDVDCGVNGVCVEGTCDETKMAVIGSWNSRSYELLDVKEFVRCQQHVCEVGQGLRIAACPVRNAVWVIGHQLHL